MSRADGYDQLLTLWGIQESLLQTYRGIFITLESIVFSISAAIVVQNPSSSGLLAILGLVVLWMWHKVCTNRAKDVSFVQWLLARAEEGTAIPDPLSKLKHFQAGELIVIGERSVCRAPKAASDERPNDEAFVSMTRSPTRRWMEIYLPLVFLALWVMLGVLVAKGIR